VLPSRASPRLADALLERHRDWIARRLAADRPVLGLAGAVWLAGERLPVERRPGRPRADLRNGRLVVAGDARGSGAALASWYRREARAAIGAAVAREAARLDLEPGPISIRDQRTRWGSCSSSGALSFSWRLVLPPRAILDYVVVHELCHLREPKHSRRFWALVDAARPGWRAEAAWLRRHGSELLAYEPAGAC
jgi:predicted metal-dependent hydrolase